MFSCSALAFLMATTKAVAMISTPMNSTLAVDFNSWYCPRGYYERIPVVFYKERLFWKCAEHCLYKVSDSYCNCVCVEFKDDDPLVVFYSDKNWTTPCFKAYQTTDEFDVTTICNGVVEGIEVSNAQVVLRDSRCTAQTGTIVINNHQRFSKEDTVFDKWQVVDSNTEIKNKPCQDFNSDVCPEGYFRSLAVLLSNRSIHWTCGRRRCPMELTDFACNCACQELDNKQDKVFVTFYSDNNFQTPCFQAYQLFDDNINVSQVCSDSPIQSISASNAKVVLQDSRCGNNTIVNDTQLVIDGLSFDKFQIVNASLVVQQQGCIS